MTWQPIETAPKDGTEILAFGRGTDLGAWKVGVPMPPMMAVTRWYAPEYEGLEEAENGLFRKVMKRMDGHWKGHFSWFDPTHWMPLPEPPK